MECPFCGKKVKLVNQEDYNGQTVCTDCKSFLKRKEIFKKRIGFCEDFSKLMFFLIKLFILLILISVFTGAGQLGILIGIPIVVVLFFIVNYISIIPMMAKDIMDIREKLFFDDYKKHE